MQKLRLNPTLTHRLSPQQLQFIRLLQVPSIAMSARIEKEITENPALEEEKSPLQDTLHDEERTAYTSESTEQIYTRRDSSRQDWPIQRALALPASTSLHEQLLHQLGLLQLSTRQHAIGMYLIGHVGHDGYLRRDLEAIVNDLFVTQHIETTVEEVDRVLKKIQDFDPPGVATRNLQECLLRQLQRSQVAGTVHSIAINMLTQCFNLFVKKHYTKIEQTLGIENKALLPQALALIQGLNPRPGHSVHASSPDELLYPDFMVTKRGEQLHVALTRYKTPTLRMSKQYIAMLAHYSRDRQKDPDLKETITFVRQRLEAARWFIDAINQRQHTLLNTMKAIVTLQRDFFLEEEEDCLKPMILKTVARVINMDVSTVARIVSNKSVQTNFGVYPLKFFFTKAIVTTSGQTVSNKAIKKYIVDIIKQEDKQKPLTDEKIAALLKDRGYPTARRTVAKYREQLRLPIARLRQELP